MYTIVIRPQITGPRYQLVTGTKGKESREIPVPAPVYPATTQLVLFTDYTGIFDADPTRRVAILLDPAGMASSADIFAAAPQIRDRRALEIRAEGDRRLAQLATPYMARERETWHVQQREAEAWQDDPQAATPMLSAIAAGRGITLAELVALVMENVDLFRAASGSILGQQQALLTRIYTEQDFTAFRAIAWPVGE